MYPSMTSKVREFLGRKGHCGCRRIIATSIMKFRTLPTLDEEVDKDRVAPYPGGGNTNDQNDQKLRGSRLTITNL